MAFNADIYDTFTYYRYYGFSGTYNYDVITGIITFDGEVIPIECVEKGAKDFFIEKGYLARMKSKFYWELLNGDNQTT